MLNRLPLSGQANVRPLRQCSCMSPRCSPAEQGTLPGAVPPQHPPRFIHGGLTIYAVSDLHCDYAANLEWVQALVNYRMDHQPTPTPSTSSRSSVATVQHSCCIVSGDISDDMRLLRATFEALTAKFDFVAFVPGNHELWVKEGPRDGSSSSSSGRNGGARNSVDKLDRVMKLCDEFGILRQPTQLGALLLVPLLSWHHQSFDKEADIPGIPRASAMTIADYSAAVWPPGFPGGTELGSELTAAWFDACNESDMQQPGWSRLQQALGSHTPGTSGTSEEGRQGLDVISFSHFLPHQSLLPEKRMLSYPNLAKAVGSDFLWRRIHQLRPNLHVFGHSHFAWDATLQGIRFLQAPLCYPAERHRRLRSITLTPQHLTHDEQMQHKQTAPKQQQSATSSSSSKHHLFGLGVHSEDASGQAAWLPVEIYAATYRAELVQQCQQQKEQWDAGCTPAYADEADLSSNVTPHDASRGRSSIRQHSRLAFEGLPILHSRELQDDQQRHHAYFSSQDQLPGTQWPERQQQHGDSSQCFYHVHGWEATWCPPLHGLWSDHYMINERRPDNTQLAPWVEQRYKRFRRRHASIQQQQQA